MNAIATIALAALAASQSDIQGTWAGTGRYPQYTAVFCEDVLAMRVGTDPILETRESRFLIDPEQGTIDIERAEGLQLGRYSIEGDKLTLMLADVNLPRPESLDFPVTKPTPGWTSPTLRKNRRVPKQAQYVFKRSDK